MLTAGQAIVDEVEAAIRAGSAEKCIASAKRVTHLFLSSAGKFNSEQVELFDNVLDRLIKTIELRALADISARMALAEISEQLAPVAQAPPAIVSRLARNDEIRIAQPILQESSRLSDDDLVEIAQTKSEQHLLAVAGRWWLKEVVTDALLERRFASVSRRVVNNPGAKVSPGGFVVILAQAGTIGPRGRDRHPRGSAVGAPASAAAPGNRRGSRSPAGTRPALSVRGDPPRRRRGRRRRRARHVAGPRLHLSQAPHRKAEGQRRSHEAALLGFARQRKYEEIIVALADLALADRSDPLLITTKPAQRWPAGAVPGGGPELGDHRRCDGMPLYVWFDGASASSMRGPVHQDDV